MNKSKINVNQLLAALRAAGVTSDQIVTAKNYMAPKPKAVKLKRAVIKRLGEMLSADGVAVVTVGKKQTRVYSMEGYKALAFNGKTYGKSNIAKYNGQKFPVSMKRHVITSQEKSLILDSIRTGKRAVDIMKEFGIAGATYHKYKNAWIQEGKLTEFTRELQPA